MAAQLANGQAERAGRVGNTEIGDQAFEAAAGRRLEAGDRVDFEQTRLRTCLLYTSDAADDLQPV